MKENHIIKVSKGINGILPIETPYDIIITVCDTGKIEGLTPEDDEFFTLEKE